MTTDNRPDLLGEQLRADAATGVPAPAFSEPLHRRVMQALRSTRPEDARAAVPGAQTASPPPISDVAAVPLAQRLRDAEPASEALPFSELLHQRVMYAVNTGQSSLAPATHQSAIGWRRPLAAAAAILIASLLAAHLARRDSGPAAPPALQAARRLEVPTAGQIVNQTAAPMLQELEHLNQQTYAAVDSDARNLAHFMARQLEFARPALAAQ
jgi:hypothetical protein